MKNKSNGSIMRKCTTVIQNSDLFVYFRTHKVSPNQAVLAVYSGEVVVLRGKAVVRSLQGCFDIMGYVLHPHGQQYPVYSPETASALTITALEADAKFEEKFETYFSCSSEVSEVKKFCKDHHGYNVLLLSKLNEDKACDFVQGVSPFESVFSIGRSVDDSTPQLESIGIAITSDSLGDRVFQPAGRSMGKRLCRDVNNGEYKSCFFKTNK